MSDQPPQQIPGDTPLTVTMSLRNWQVVLKLLYEGPFSLLVAGPVYGEIDRQCGQQIHRARTNGEMTQEVAGHG